MQKIYYFDSCIWFDYYENRFGQGGRPLGEYAAKIMLRIIKNKEIILFCDLTIKELKTLLNDDQIETLFTFLTCFNIIKKVEASDNDIKEAAMLAKERNIPPNDALHAVIAKNNDAVLLSQDKHLHMLKDILEVRRPEELL